MPSNHLILCHPFHLLPSIFPSIKVFGKESVLHMRGPKYGASASASVLPMNIQEWFSLELTGLISLQSKGLSRVFFNTTVQKHQFFSAQLSLWLNTSLTAQLVTICLQCRRSRFYSWVGKTFWRRDRLPTPVLLGFPCSSVGKESTCNMEDLGSIPGLGKSPKEGKGYPHQYSGLENSMDSSPWGHKELDMTEWLSLSLTSIHDYCKNHRLDYMDLCWQSNVFAFKHAV